MQLKKDIIGRRMGGREGEEGRGRGREGKGGEGRGGEGREGYIKVYMMATNETLKHCLLDVDGQ